MTALSNMPLINKSRVLASDDERSNDDYWTKSDFESTPFMSTYLLAFVVAEFQSRNTTGHAGLKVGIVMYMANCRCKCGPTKK